MNKLSDEEEETSVSEIIEDEDENKDEIIDPLTSIDPLTASSLPSDSHTYFSREWRNLQRKRFVKYLHDILKSDQEETNKMTSFSIKCIHFAFPIIVAVISMLSPGWVVYALFVSCILIKILFWYFNGCFLSNLEYKLHKENDVNVVDPIVFAFGKKISKESRIEVTVKATNLLITFLAALIIWKENRELSCALIKD